jgi:hypothetical protein
MSEQTLDVRDLDTADYQLAPLNQLVHVETLADSHVIFLV